MAGLDLTAAVGRVLIAAIFLVSGWSKLMQPTGALGYIEAFGLPLPAAALALAIIVEIGGGLLLIVGYRTRLTAGILAMFTLVTALIFHSLLGDPNEFNHFFKNVAMAGGLLQIAAFGPGRLTIGRTS